MPKIFKHLMAFVVCAVLMANIASANAVDIPLHNPSFEEPTQGTRIQGWRLGQHAGVRAYEFAIDSTQATDGKQSYRIKRTADQIYGLLQQRVNVAAFAEKKVELSADMKGEALGPLGWVLTVNIETPNGITQQLRATALTASSDWKRYTLPITLPVDVKSLNIAIILLDSGTGWVDNIKLRTLD